MLRPATWKLLTVGRRLSTWSPLATAFNTKSSGMFDFNFGRNKTDVREKLLKEIEKSRKINNVVIEGLNYIKYDSETLKSKVEEWLLHNLGVKPLIEDVWKNDKGINERICLKCKTWESKQLILNNKHKLKGTRIIIDHDFTAEEIKKQKIIKFVAKCLKNEGRTKIKVAYEKLYIGNEKWYWNDIKSYYESKLGLEKLEKKDNGGILTTLKNENLDK